VGHAVSTVYLYANTGVEDPVPTAGGDVYLYANTGVEDPVPTAGGDVYLYANTVEWAAPDWLPTYALVNGEWVPMAPELVGALFDVDVDLPEVIADRGLVVNPAWDPLAPDATPRFILGRVTPRLLDANGFEWAVSVTTDGALVTSVQFQEVNDSFVTDTLAEYPILANVGSGWSWDAANEWAYLWTGDNDNIKIGRGILGRTTGYAKLEMRRLAAYPTDMSVSLSIMESATDLYRFTFQGPAYGSEGVARVAGGVTVDSAVRTGTVATNGVLYTIEMWWSPALLKLVINGGTPIEVVPTGEIALFSSWEFYVSQANLDIASWVIGTEQP